MRKLLKTVAVVITTGWLCSCSGEKTEANYQVIPAPQEIVMAANGDFTLGSGVKIVYPEGNEAMRRNAEYLAEYLQKATGNVSPTMAGTDGKGNIRRQL
ncbi:MAG: glycoside hydrolase family 20 zincin-like fold domain-containing protein, partial [Bacteroides sp.]|nr:glycoside hydrolase family 20 zincin-like fold domain-containing protein [Bacteroides sp.]